MAAGAVLPQIWWARFGYGTVGTLGPELINWIEILNGPWLSVQEFTARLRSFLCKLSTL